MTVGVFNKSFLETLFSHGADIKHKTYNDNDALSMVIIYKDLDMVKTLLDKNANRNVWTHLGENCLFLAPTTTLDLINTL